VIPAACRWVTAATAPSRSPACPRCAPVAARGGAREARPVPSLCSSNLAKARAGAAGARRSAAPGVVSACARPRVVRLLAVLSRAPHARRPAHAARVPWAAPSTAHGRKLA